MIRKVFAVVAAGAVAFSGLLVGAPAAQAGSLNVLGVTMSWDDSTMYAPQLCSIYKFRYNNGFGGRLSTMGFTLTDPYGNQVARSTEIGVPAGASGIWNEQICKQQLSNGLGPYTMTLQIEDYYSSSQEASTPFYFIERPSPLPSAPQVVSALIKNRDGSVGWGAPEANSTSVSAYAVTDTATGAEVCRVPATGSIVQTCDVAGLADGPHAFIVRAISSGNPEVSSAPTATYIVGPPQVSSPPKAKKKKDKITFTMSTDMGTTAVPVRFFVQQQNGKRVCRAKVTEKDLDRGYATCKAKKPSKATRYRTQVVTLMGTDSGPLGKKVKP